MTPTTESSANLSPWRYLISVVIAVVAIGMSVVACGGADEADAIHGTWYWQAYFAFETFEPDGTWSVTEGTDPTPYDWGTYTLEDGILTMVNADDSLCPGSTAVFEVTFSKDGDTLFETVVSDSCDVEGVVRGQNRYLTRDIP